MAFADSNETDPLEQVVIPLHAEEVSVGKRQVATGRVKVSTLTRAREELVEEILQSERVEVDRVPVGKVITQMPEVRTEDDTMIIPVVEEVVVLQRQLVLKEEVRVRRIRETQNYREHVVLRRQEAVITRVGFPRTTTQLSQLRHQHKKNSRQRSKEDYGLGKSSNCLRQRR